jgi:hypothetical protein
VKQVLFLIILIGWSIWQARRKAMREQRRRQQEDIVPEPVAAQATPANNWPPVTDEPDQFLQQMEADVPESVRPLLEAARKPKRKKRKPVEATADGETVERIVADVPVIEVSAYDAVTPVRRRIRFDKEALQAFMVTREVLGPPRAKRPHRPGIRNR